MLDGNPKGQVVKRLFQQKLQTIKNLGALVGRSVAPGRERRFGRRDRLAYLTGPAHRHLRDLLPAGRIEY